MSCRKIIIGATLILLGLTLSPAYADDATVEALGNAKSVLEDETTSLTLFNLGNPAGMAFLPRQDRLDLSLQSSQRLEVEEFTTVPSDQMIGIAPVSSSYQSITTTVYNEPGGNTITTNTTTFSHYCFYRNLDSHGNTLPANTQYTWKRALLSAGLLSGASLYKGVLLWPYQDFALHVIPLGNWECLASSDEESRLSSWQAGGLVRSAYQLFPNTAFGVGIAGSESSLSYTGYHDRTSSTGVELGLAYRLQEIFESEDSLLLGLLLTGLRDDKRVMEFQANTTQNFMLPESLNAQSFCQLNRPALVELQGIYNYKSVMDIALQLKYGYEDIHLSWSDQNLLFSTLHNVDYDLQFRVRLPMVREDDLRFGVSFNNHGGEHPFPTGRLDLLAADTLVLQKPIQTFSSGITIGMALVPDDGSIVALEYSLGSSKTRQEDVEAALADSGFSKFSLGAQYRLLAGLFLRAGYVDCRLTNESTRYQLLETTTKTVEMTNDIITSAETAYDYTYTPYFASEITYTRAFTFGVGIEDGSWQWNLTVKCSNLTHTPAGWDIPQKPEDLDNVNKDSDYTLAGMLSLTWMF